MIDRYEHSDKLMLGIDEMEFLLEAQLYMLDAGEYDKCHTGLLMLSEQLEGLRKYIEEITDICADSDDDQTTEKG